MGCYDCLVGSFVDPTDDFTQLLRKGAVGYFFCCAPLAVLFIILNFVTYGPTHPAVIISNISLLLMTIMCVGTYLYVRLSAKHVSDTLATLFIWGLLFTLAFASFLVDPSWDNKSLVFITLFTALLIRIRYLPVFLVVAMVFQAVNIWNAANVGLSDNFLVISSFSQPSLLNNLFSEGSGTILLIIGAYLMYIQTQQTEKQAAAQQAANKMTVKVLNVQRNYDCEEIDKILDTCGEEGVVDAEMIQLFRVMNSNLKSYKPFLPNYLFQRDSNGDEEDEEEEDASVASGVRDGDVLSRASSRAKKRKDSYAQRLQEGSDSDSRSVRSFRSARAGGGNTAAAAAGHHPVLTTTALTNKRGALFTGRITMGLVELNLTKILSGNVGRSSAHETETAAPLVSQNGEIYNILVNEIFKAAASAKASVHSLLGDTAQLTWNATHPVALGETKGASFLARLSAVLSELSQSKEWTQRGRGSICGIGAIVTGKASVHSILTSSTQQQALVIEAGNWLSILETQMKLARRHRCVLLDENSERAASLEVESLAVEALSVTEGGGITAIADRDLSRGAKEVVPTTKQSVGKSIMTTDDDTVGDGRDHEQQISRKSSLVYCVMGEKTRKDDEWMYQLRQSGEDAAKRESGPHALLSSGTLRQILESMMHSRFGEALSSIVDLEDTMEILNKKKKNSSSEGTLSANERSILQKYFKIRTFIEKMHERAEEEMRK